MRNWVSIEEAQERLDDLIQEIGAGESLTIMKDGDPVGTLSALAPAGSAAEAIRRLRDRMMKAPRTTQEEIRIWRDQGRR